MTRHRRLIVLRGEVEATRAEAHALTSAIPPEDVLFIGDGEGSVPPSRVKRLLGRAFDAVVLDLHAGLDADVLGQCHGFVWGGGSLVLRMPLRGVRPRAMNERLAVHPFSSADVGSRFWDRFERCIERSEALAPTHVLSPVSHAVHGTEEQRRVVDALARALVDRSPSLSVLLSDRGRGKSSALGLALHGALARAPLRVAITAAEPESTAEIFRFALGSPTPASEGPALAQARPTGGGCASAEREPGGGAPPKNTVRFVAPTELVRGPSDYDVVLVDEAAQLPVPLLEALVRHHPHARIALATTARGYEGTGRGFVLRFLEWLEREPRPLARHTLHAPIRWDEGDPLERFVFDALFLDAEPSPAPTDAEVATVEHTVVDRDALASDERLLRELFGLLVHAHYRTTPSDLSRMLDAPNVAIHASIIGGHVAAASLVAREGALPREACEALAMGKTRIRGHALADTLITHAGRPDAGELAMVRSVRVAVHPALRRRRLGMELVEHVHRTYSPDLFGTIFGATPELVRFRRAAGYELVRVGVSRGSRTGEPAAVMIRAVSGRAIGLVDALRRELARELPRQLALLESEGELGLDPELTEALLEGLPAAAPLAHDELCAIVRSYVRGPRPFESVAVALARFVEENAGALAILDARSRALIEGRVLHGRPWAGVAREAGYESVAAAMRALRPAIRALARHVDPELDSAS